MLPRPGDAQSVVQLGLSFFSPFRRRRGYPCTRLFSPSASKAGLASWEQPALPTAKQASPRHQADRDCPQDEMSPGGSRKKPVCQKCSMPMAGHKRPYGAPVCPRDEGSPTPRSSPSLSHAELPEIQEPTDSPPPPLVAPYIKSRTTSRPDIVIKPTASGYWHRSNPHYVDFDPQPSKPHHIVPARQGSWVSTESASGSHGSPARRQLPPARGRCPEVVDVDAEDVQGGETQEHEDDDRSYAPEDFTDTQSNVSTTSSHTILKRVTRGLSTVIGRSTPIASLYNSPREAVPDITSAAEAEGLYAGVVHRTRNVKAEPTTPTRDHSWFVAVGRDRSAVNALLNTQTPRKSSRSPAGPEPVRVTTEPPEPYDFQRGLSSERNERIGTFPMDPARIHGSFFDTLFAGAIGGLVMFYCLSSL